MTGLPEMLLATALAVAVAMSLLWLISLAARDASVVDVFWGIGFALIAWLGFALGDGPTSRRALVALLTTAWGLRLATHLAWRNVGLGEDFRYRAMRRRHGGWFPLASFYLVFGLQGLLMWIISLPLQVAQASPEPAALGVWDAAGAAVWAVGLTIESVADRQLARFRSEQAHPGGVLDRGLWAWTRHPNYFGDALVWWGLYGFAVAAGGWWTGFGPLLMTGLLMRVSGVPMLERTLRQTKPGYARYAERTSAFFPRPPRRLPGSTSRTEPPSSAR